MKYIPYIAILVLILIILLQNEGCKDNTSSNKPRIDTVVVYKEIHDTTPGKVQFVTSKIDTSIWINRNGNKPDSTYNGLLNQYKDLGNKHFSTNVFKTDFQIADYGYITVEDNIQENKLKSSVIFTNLKIPITTITIEKEADKKNQLYIGTNFVGNKYNPLSGVYGGLLLKTKKDRIYQASIGYNGKTMYQIGLYFKIRLKK